MKKIDFNIELPGEDVFNEILFKKENEELYKKYLFPPTDKAKLEIVKNWISNMLARAINGVRIADEKTGVEKSTKTTTMDVQCDYSRVINAIKKHKDGWVKLEDSDFKFLCEKWKEAKIPCQENIALILASINEAIETAKTYKGNPDK